MATLAPMRDVHVGSPGKVSWLLWIRNLFLDPGLLIAVAFCLLLPSLHQSSTPGGHYPANQQDLNMRFLNSSSSTWTTAFPAVSESSAFFTSHRFANNGSFRGYDIHTLAESDEGLQWDEREDEVDDEIMGAAGDITGQSQMPFSRDARNRDMAARRGLSGTKGSTSQATDDEDVAGQLPQGEEKRRSGGQELEVTPVGRLKIFVYDLPARYNRNFIKKEPRCLTHMFALEVLFHQYVLTSPVRTTNPQEADWFYMPVYLTCDLTPSGLPLPFRSPRMLRAAISLVSTRWPYWNRSEGADHFFITPHDFGACFHYEEEKAIGRGIMPLLARATLVQTFGQRHHVCHRQGSIVVPPYAPLTNMHRRLLPPDTPRSIFVYFRGLFYDTNNDPKGGYYARGARASIWENFKDNPLFDISPAHPASYYEDMQRSIFCLCPLGWAPWSPRLVESVFFGCIPVIIADDIVLPFSDVIPWREIAVFVPEEDVPKLDSVLASIGPRKILDMQRRLSHPAIRRAVVLAHPPQEGDVFHQVLNGLARKLPHPRSTYLSPGEPRTLNWTAGPVQDLKPWRPNSPVFW